MRTTKTFEIENSNDFQHRLLAWAQQFREVVFLDSNSEFNQNQKYKSFDFAMAADAFTSIETDFENAFEGLKQYQQTTRDWIFGYLGFDLKNDLEKLESNNFDGLGFSDLYFFQPKKLFIFRNNTLEISYLRMCDDEIDDDIREILDFKLQDFDFVEKNNIEIQERVSREVYIQKVEQIINYIQKGNIYEMNFCIEFYAQDVTINPIQKYLKLNEISRAPFACFFKKNQHFLISASPERYLKKIDDLIISQPIKGTSARFEDIEQDNLSILTLQNDAKERSENIMISDLVRNDLSRTAKKGTVSVEELCGLYSFLQVHQLITTVTSELNKEFSALDALKTTFPMGSMTGAPKVSAMQIIENQEETKRGLYSGAVGYFTPEADFDFNVVIRTILYNQKQKYLSFSVGSAITSLSNPEKEYEECLLKAKAMQQVLNCAGH